MATFFTSILETMIPAWLKIVSARNLKGPRCFELYLQTNLVRMAFAETQLLILPDNAYAEAKMIFWFGFWARIWVATSVPLILGMDWSTMTTSNGFLSRESNSFWFIAS